MSLDDTSHADLMDAASRIAYQEELYDPKLSLPHTVRINGRIFWIVDVRVDPNTGLDALTLQNRQTGEITIAFQGTDGMTDVLTDGTLVTAATPDQYRAALAYVRGMIVRFGRVDSVCGNSLGGGLAAYVGTQYPGILAVTVNPAPVPAEASGTDPANVVNYISDLDPLHRAVTAGGLADRIAGQVVRFSGTSANIIFLGPNHIGSDRGDVELSPFNASMGVPFSLFHADRVIGAGDYGGRIDLDFDAMDQMARGLAMQRTNLRTVSAAELSLTREELSRYRAQIPSREAALRDHFQGVMADWWWPLRQGIERIGNEIERGVRDVWRRLVVPELVRPVAGWLFDQVADQIDTLTSALQEAGDAAVETAADDAWGLHRELFRLGSREITDGLLAEVGRLDQDDKLILQKWSAFGRMIRVAGATMVAADEAVASAMAAGRAQAKPVVPSRSVDWPAGRVNRIEESLAKARHQRIIDRRQQIAGEMLGGVGTALSLHLTMVIEAVLSRALLAVTAVELTCEQIKTAITVGTYTPALLVGAAVTGTADDLSEFRTTVRRTLNSVEAELGDARSAIWEVQDALSHLPILVQNFKVYVTSSLFSDTVLETSCASLLKVQSLAERSALAFGEVEYQLGWQRATLIGALADRAVDVRADLVQVGENITEMVT